MLELKRRTIILTLTRSCNLNCRYCFEHNKSNEIMSFEVAMKIINEEYSKLLSDEILEVDFFGGEPFLAFDVLKKIVERIQESEMHDKIIFFVDTNGTLLTEKIREWLAKRADNLICGLSYDGNSYMQDINRCNSSSNIDLSFFEQTYPYQTVKMTVSQETLPYLAEGVEYLEKKGFEVACNLAYGVDWDNDNNCIILERELKKLVLHYLEHPEFTPCSLLNNDILAVAFQDKGKNRFCGAGINMVAYDIDGKRYPCQLFMPISVGAEKAKKSKELSSRDVIPENLLDDKCKNCVIKSVCPTCYGANYMKYSNIYQQDEGYCKLQKIVFKAISFYKGKQWAMGQLELDDTETALLLKSIEIIQKNL